MSVKCVLADQDKEGKRTVRFVIGTSQSGWTADQVDYLCDGTADDVEINAAIQALPDEGGEIKILDGEYNITSNITPNKDNIVLEGSSNTVLKRQYEGTTTDGIITIDSNNYIIIRQFYIDGNKENYPNNTSGIFIKSCNNITIVNNNITNIQIGINVNNTSNDNSFLNNIISNGGGTGIRLFSGNNRNKISNNIISEMGGSGFSMQGSNKNNIISGNEIFNCGNFGIYIVGGQDNYNLITKNNCYNNANIGIYQSMSYANIISSNHCCNNKSGIKIYQSARNTITNNCCLDNTVDGISVDNNCKNNIVSNNTCLVGNGNVEDYSDEQYTIRVLESNTVNPTENNLIIGNNIMGKNYVVSTANSSNTFSFNKYQKEYILPIELGGTGVSDLKSLYLALQEFEPVWSGWGRQDEVGDATWWTNLKTWLSTSTAAQRQKCVGLTKKVSLSTPVLGANAATMICIGADQDKNAYSQCSSLTFQTLGVLPNTTAFGSNALWDNSTVQTLCNNFATYCSAKDSIMSSYYSKLTSNACNNSRTNSADVSTTMKVWIPSEQEMGLDKYSPSRSETSSTGVQTLTNTGYSYYNNNARRIKYKMTADGSLTTTTESYWTRSRCYSTNYSNYACIVTSSGTSSYEQWSSHYSLAPAFVIAHYQGAVAS